MTRAAKLQSAATVPALIALIALIGLTGGTAPAGAAGAVAYPLALTLDAKIATATASAASKVDIRVDRLMEESRRKRVTDALTYSGYGNFLTALRSLPAVGSIALQSRKVDVKYANEQPDEAGRRLVLVADRPLVFLSGDPQKTRTGYELTIVELRFDGDGNVSGTMAGAARVKPSPDGIVLDDFAEAPVQLTARPTPQ